jgi:predicted Zn-dependent protease
MASLSGVWKAVQIIRPDGRRVADIRPLVRLSVAIVVGDGDRMETGSSGAGGRVGYDLYLDPQQWKAQVDEALRHALVNLGSLTVDDEGTPTNYTVLIEDGILKGYMQDRMNARLLGAAPTGNGRRQSFAHAPMPRMTNTYMLAGRHDPAEIMASVKRGVYAVNFGGGQVDITSGKFVFSASEAYLIEDGKVGPAVKGATLIGNGPDALTKVTMIGNDLRLDDGIGTCGKDGQSVPVGVGQPTLRMDGLTVGGTNA